MSLVNFPDPKIKTPSVQTLGVLLFGLLGFAANVATADCMPAGKGETVFVEYVYDGDTVKLTDGRHVRVLGINAPEVDHGEEKTGQVLGNESRQAAEAFFKSDKTARLFYDRQHKDHFGRTLAHIYDVKGNSLGASLLRSGLAFHVAIPPNLSLNDCLVAQESIARKKGLGVWNNAAWTAKPAKSLGRNETGFQRIYGRVLAVNVKQSVWLEMEGLLAIKISPSDLGNFPIVNWQTLKGRQIEVRGWVGDREGSNAAAKKPEFSAAIPYKPLILQPRIASNLELLATD